VEIDPRTLTTELAAAFGRAGVNRASLGVQSFDPKGQAAINRVQSFAVTANAVRMLRERGIPAINFDLVYGLPFQSVQSCLDTVEQALRLQPDRLAVFGYAHVPEFKPHQRKIDEATLPGPAERHEQAEAIARALTTRGYRQIGLDHFALPGDSLSSAAEDGTLHRNFQGYTTHAGCDLYGMGVSAISSVNDTYAQNTKDYAEYHAATAAGTPPIVKGHRLTPDDFLRRDVITRLLCHCVLKKREIEKDYGLKSFDETFASAIEKLPQFVEDGMVVANDEEIRVTTMGRIFIRNVAMLFDSYLEKKSPEAPKIFSRTL
jgi:oxygen-independent coproporphyrinogen-3 oxidase